MQQVEQIMDQVEGCKYPVFLDLQEKTTTDKQEHI